MNRITTYIRENTTFVAILFVCILLLAIFVAIATRSGAWPGTDASSQILSALAGAIVAAIITLFLLLGQTASEEMKERNAKIFEEKLRIYQEFLRKLCDVVKDQKITSEEEIELQFQVSYIAMHTSPKSINTISGQVRDIVINIKKGEADGNEMLGQLFIIADTFYQELYGKEYGKDNGNMTEDRKNTLMNFNSILVQKEDIEEYEDIQNKSIIDSFAGKELKELSPQERAAKLKAMINPNGSKQWIWNGYCLVHEFFTEINKNTGNYVKGKTKNTIAIDLLIEDKFTIRVGTRKNDPKETEKVAIAVDGKFTPVNPITSPHWHLHKQLPLETTDEEMARIMEELLEKVKSYRDKTYPPK
jgi:hypothetical protein